MNPSNNGRLKMNKFYDAKKTNLLVIINARKNIFLPTSRTNS